MPALTPDNTCKGGCIKPQPPFYSALSFLAKQSMIVLLFLIYIQEELDPDDNKNKFC